MDRPPTWRCRVQVEGTTSKQIYECVPFCMYEGSISFEPLSLRGWTLQELILPRRIIQFTSSQIFFTCNEGVSCENFLRGIPNEIWWDDQDWARKKSIQSFNWTQIVRDYSTRNLTFEKDRLIAIAGLAAVVGREDVGACLLLTLVVCPKGK